MVQLSKTLLIARTTFREMLKSKILWNVGVIGLLMAILTYVSSEFTFGAPLRVAIDIGLASLSLSSYVITLLIGVSLIQKEEDSRTIYLIISRPASRTSFLVGKILGVVAFLALNVFLLCCCTVAIVLLLGGKISPLVATAMLFSVMEAVMLLCVVVLLSLVANPALTLMGAVLVLVAGHAVVETSGYAFVKSRPWLQQVLDFYHLVLPGFYRFNLKDLVLHQEAVSTGQVLYVTLYWLCYSCGLVSASAWILNRKNLD